MIYTNVLSAVVSALAAECKDSTSRQAILLAEGVLLSHAA